MCKATTGLFVSYVATICTRGQPPWGSRDSRLTVHQFHAFAVPFVWVANEEQRKRGLHIETSDVQRIPAASVDPTAKNHHWSDLTMGLLPVTRVHNVAIAIANGMPGQVTHSLVDTGWDWLIDPRYSLPVAGLDKKKAPET
jgi:branched-chain amino acid aminotransferase